MMKLEVLGTGCAKCRALEQAVRAAADELAAPYELEHVSDLDAIVDRGVASTPALVVDGEVVAAGRVPRRDELAALLRRAAGVQP